MCLMVGGVFIRGWYSRCWVWRSGAYVTWVPVFRKGSMVLRVVDSECVLVVMVSVIDDGLFCSGGCWAVLNHFSRL